MLKPISYKRFLTFSSAFNAKYKGLAEWCVRVKYSYRSLSLSLLSISQALDEGTVNADGTF